MQRKNLIILTKKGQRYLGIDNFILLTFNFIL